MNFHYYQPTKPKAVKGGIKAKNKRGAFGETWWARRWIEVLESFDIGARLGRGKTYARKGQVKSIRINKGIITAKVQGSYPRPYKISIEIDTFSKNDWRKIADKLSHEASFFAKLIAGQMPENIEDAFAELGMSLFPKKENDLRTDCDCPDWSNPCKHLAAVYYIVGEEFDRDPFLIFKLRGIEKDAFLELMGMSETIQDEEEVAQPEALPMENFWQSPKLDINTFAEKPTIDAHLPKRLGNFPLWQAEEEFISTLENIYKNAC